AFGGDDIGAAAQQVGRSVAVRNSGSGWDDARILQLSRVSPGLRAHQHVQPVQLRFEVDAQRLQGGARLRQERFGLGNFAVRREAAAEAEPDQVEQLHIRADLLFGNSDASLVAVDLEIRVGGVGGDRYARAEPSRVRG